MSTLLKVCPATASDEQSVPSENHALILQHQRHTPISVTGCLSHCQTLQRRKDRVQHKTCEKYFIKHLKL